MAVALVVAALAILPALLYVYQRTEAAATGYTILQLQRELAGLESEHARLQTTVSTLRSPQRIERIATSELGMVPPRQRQLAAITTAPAVALAPAPPSLAQRIGAWLGLGEAQAHELDR
jgi:cell division protein FtsL